MYKIGHNMRSIAAGIYKHRVLRAFIDLMVRVLFGVDGLVTLVFVVALFFDHPVDVINQSAQVVPTLNWKLTVTGTSNY